MMIKIANTEYVLFNFILYHLIWDANNVLFSGNFKINFSKASMALS